MIEKKVWLPLHSAIVRMTLSKAGLMGLSDQNKPVRYYSFISASNHTDKEFKVMHLI